MHTKEYFDIKHARSLLLNSYLNMMARARVQANKTVLNLYAFNCKHTYTHTSTQVKTARKQTYTDIPTHITRIHTQTTFIHTCEKHTKTNTHLMALRLRGRKPTDIQALFLHTHIRTHTHSPLTLSPLLRLISRSPWAECERVATNTRPGTAL